MPDEKDKSFEDLENRVDEIADKVEDHESQIGRIVSHVESEIGLARRDVGSVKEDIKTLDAKLFGDGKDEHSGRLGQIVRRLSKLEIMVFSIAGAASIIMFIVVIYQFLVGIAKK